MNINEQIKDAIEKQKQWASVLGRIGILSNHFLWVGLQILTKKGSKFTGQRVI